MLIVCLIGYGGREDIKNNDNSLSDSPDHNYMVHMIYFTLHDGNKSNFWSIFVYIYTMRCYDLWGQRTQ